VLASLLVLALLTGEPTERLAGVRVQGNTLTAESEIVGLAAVEIGASVSDAVIDRVKATLERTGRFDRVEVLKRYASIADPSQVLLVIIVDEGPVVIRRDSDGRLRAVRRRGPPLMFLPLLGSEDGYGFTYGALVTWPNMAGRGTRLSVPLTWGGERKVGAEFERRFTSNRLTRLRAGGALVRRENDALAAIDRREQLWVRGEREIVRPLRLGAWSGFDAVTFGSADSFNVRTGVDAVFDTRVDPMLSRNAVYVRGAIEHFSVRDDRGATRTLLDASAYLPGPFSSILVARVYRDGANAPLPAYLKVLLGRETTLRGFRAASAAGDSTAAGTLELRVPLTSPLNTGRLGVRAFIDAAAVYDAGERLRKQRFSRGIGGGVWFAATVIRLAVDVAHGSNGQTRVVASSGTTF
jgi:outer membrane protein assembly factor BamA